MDNINTIDKSDGQKEETKSYFLDDSPIGIEDQFDIHSDIAKTIAHIIEKKDVSQHSFTMGLFGEWGSGKSFIIEKIKEELKGKPEILFLYIDAWKYADFPLLRSILFDIDKQLKQISKEAPENSTLKKFENGYKKDQVKSLESILYCDEELQEDISLTYSQFKNNLLALCKTYKSYIKWLILVFLIFVLLNIVDISTWAQNQTIITITSIFKPLFSAASAFGAFFGIAAIFISLMKKPLEKIGNLILFKKITRDLRVRANFSPEQFECILDDIHDQLTAEGGVNKIVLVFDNIDRCEPKLAYETLSTIKTFMDKKNFIYIIPCDDDAIKRYIASDISGTSINGNDNGNGQQFYKDYAREFIDKLFQTYIRIPILKEVDRDKFIKTNIRELALSEDLGERDIDVITQILYYAYKGETPRNIKRFLNDFSFNYLLAKNSYPDLLNNLKMFTVMTAIKQVFPEFEKVLIDNQDFFKLNYNNRIPMFDDIAAKNSNINMTQLGNFLNNISVIIQQIAHEPIEPYIYVKESSTGVEIINGLRDGNIQNISINDENLIVIKKKVGEAASWPDDPYFSSSMKAIILLLDEFHEKYGEKLASLFWGYLLELEDKDATNTIFSIIKLINEISKREILIRSIPLSGDLKNNAEDIIISFFIRPRPESEESEYSHEKKLLHTIISEEEHTFPPGKIKRIFNEWQLDNNYLNALLKEIGNSKKKKYLPEKVLKKAMNSVKDNTLSPILDLFDIWPKATDIPQDIRKDLSKFIYERLEKKFENTTMENENLRAIGFIYEEDFYDTLKGDWCDELYNRAISLSSSNETLGIDYVIEGFYFLRNKSELETKYAELLSNTLSETDYFRDYLVENLGYADEILDSQEIRRVLLRDQEIAKEIYKKMDMSKHKIGNIICLPLELENLQTYISTLKERDTTFFDGVKFAEAVIPALFDGIKNDIIDNPTSFIGLLKDHSDDESLGEKIIIYKNIIVDFCVEHPEEGVELLKSLNDIVNQRKLKKECISPFLSQIKKLLVAHTDVSDYSNFYELIDQSYFNTEKTTRKKLIAEVIKLLLELGQEPEENYFGIRLLEISRSHLIKKDLSDIEELIKNNDNKDEWDKEILGILEEMKIISSGEEESAEE